LRSTRAFDDVEFNGLTFFQSFEAFGLNCGEVYEYVAAVFSFDETVTFFCVEPFYFTLHALTFPSSSNEVKPQLENLAHNSDYTIQTYPLSIGNANVFLELICRLMMNYEERWVFQYYTSLKAT